MIGTLEEAQEIFDAVGDRWNLDYRAENCPEGWTFLGSGGTRSVYLSPSGVAYKVCHNYEDEETPNYNEVEHYNFEVIRKHHTLPGKWRVPMSHIHQFNGRYKRYNAKTFKAEPVITRIAVLACEYVKGETFTWDDPEDMCVVFAHVGLFDTVRSNAMKGDDGYRYIVDAAEEFLPVPELV